MTFLEYLTDYMRRLSYAETADVKILAHESQTNNHRLREPLFLYALFSDQTDVLLTHIKESDAKQEYEQLLKKYNCETMELALKEQSSELRERYTRVWKSYLVRANKPQREERVKTLIRDNINKMLKEHNVSNSTIAKKLNLEERSVSSWLDGESSVDLETARRVLNYVECFIDQQKSLQSC